MAYIEKLAQLFLLYCLLDNGQLSQKSRCYFQLSCLPQLPPIQVIPSLNDSIC